MSQFGSAYWVRRSPSRSVTTTGRHRACQAARASASAFCRSDVGGGAARTTLPPLTAKSVDWLGVSGRPARMASALASAAAAAAFEAAAAAAALPWSISKDGEEDEEAGAGGGADAAGASWAGASWEEGTDASWAVAVEMPAAINNKTTGTIRMYKPRKGIMSGPLLCGEG